jgi:acetolactate synthase-1/2/3 large subunit
MPTALDEAFTQVSTIVLGSRLDIRQTGSKLASFSVGKQIWQIDIDPAEMGVQVKPTHSRCCSIADMARVLVSFTKRPQGKHLHWSEQNRSLRQQYPAEREYPCLPGQINPIALLQMLSKQAPNPSHDVTDVGQHQMWAAQSLEDRLPRSFLTSGGMGAIGFGLPAAIGSAFAEPEVTTILISGDGSFQINVQELETVKRNPLAIKIILFNNNCHGMVRQFQDSYFGGNEQSTCDGYSSPNFTAVAAAHSIAARCVHTEDEVAAGLNWLLSTLLEAIKIPDLNT